MKTGIFKFASLFAVLVLAMFCVLALSACDGGDDSTSPTRPGDTGTSETSASTTTSNNHTSEPSDGTSNSDDDSDDEPDACVHVPVIDVAAVSPTCTATGKASQSHCSLCNEVLSAQEVLPAYHAALSYEAPCPNCGLTATAGLYFETLWDNDNAYRVSVGTATGTEIIIPAMYNGKPVTTIAEDAFADCTDITEVWIPASVTTIEGYAFKGCTSLATISLPESVTTIGAVAFARTNLTSITIPASVTAIGSTAFDECDNLNAVYITDLAAWCEIAFANNFANPLYYAGKLYLDDALVTTLTIPAGVTTIGDYVFYGYTNLTQVTIPAGVQTIGADAFYGCKNLASPILPTGLQTIGQNAFAGCTQFTSVTIPATVTTIGENAYGGCTNLGAVYTTDIAAWCAMTFENGTANPLYYAHKLYLNDVPFGGDIPAGVTKIGQGAFTGANFTSVNIPASVTTIGNHAFEDCTKLTQVTLPSLFAGLQTIGQYAFSGCTNLRSVTLQSGLQTIGYEAFKDCKYLTSITIPASVTSIESGAFDGCYRLIEVQNRSTTLSISKGSTANGSVGYYAKHIYTEETGSKLVVEGGGLRVWYLDTTERYLVCDLASGIHRLPTVAPDDGNYAVYNYAFEGQGLISLTIPASVTAIGDYAFKGCYQLIEVQNLSALSISRGSSAHGGVAYYAKNVYTATSGSSKVETSDDEKWYWYIDGTDRLLAGYSGETASPLVLPEPRDDMGVLPYQIANYAFYGRTNLQAVTIPASVTAIGQYAFYGCTSLQSVTFAAESTLESIGGYAFYGCESLASITIPAGVARIESNTFEYCTGLQSVTFAAESTLEYIGGAAFADCKSLSSITIPASVAVISENAFSGCAGLQSVTFAAESILESIGYYAFYGCKSLTSITIPASVWSIGYETFGGCTDLQSATFAEPNGWNDDTGALDVSDAADNALLLQTSTSLFWREVL